MVLVSILDSTITLFGVIKPLVGSPKVHRATVTIPADQSHTFDVDVWAMYLKKALSDAQLTSLKGQEVGLIVAQRYLDFHRIDIPTDVTEAALGGYVKNYIREHFPHGDDLTAFEVAANRGARKVNVFILPTTTYQSITTLISLFDGEIKHVYPEAPLLFASFSHTLNRTKPEPVLFMEYAKEQSTGYYFDADGYYSNEILRFPSKDLVSQLQTIAHSDHKPSRIIMGGSLSQEMRQDSFTKEVGIWTNPLHRVIGQASFSSLASQLAIPPQELMFYIRELIAYQGSPVQFNQTPTYRKPFPYAKYLRILLVVLSTALLTILVVWGFSHIKIPSLSVGMPKIPAITKATPTPTPPPRPTPTPTPAFTRSDYTVSILNGEGTPGLANTYKARIEKLEYSVSSVGNAPQYGEKQTTIRTGNRELYETLKKDLAPYIKNPVYEKTTATDSAQIILGEDSV